MTIAHLKGEVFQVSQKCFNFIFALKFDVEYYLCIYISLKLIKFLVFMKLSCIVFHDTWLYIQYLTACVTGHQVKSEQERADRTELLQELLEVRNDVASTKEELNSYRQHNEKLQEELQVREVSISKLKEELQGLRKNVDTTKEELDSYREHNEKLKDELHVRELSISKLNEELQEVQTALMKTAESGPPYPSSSPSPSPSPQPQSSASSSSTTQPKRKGARQPAGKGSSAKDKPSLSKKNSSSSSQSSNRSHSSRLNSISEPQHVAVKDSFTQTEPLQMSDLSPGNKSATKEEMEEVIGEFQEKIVQMQELHAAEILDMEARHISESENLRRDTHALEDECKALKAIIDKLRSTEVRAGNKKEGV